MPDVITDQIPQELQAALRGASAFNPIASRDEYTANQALWQLYHDLMELDQTKLQALIDKLHADEPDAKLNLRKAMAAVFNLIPLVLDVIRLYIFSDEPSFDVGSDDGLKEFLDDCDGSGTSFAEFIRQTALPLCLGMGWVDALVQNPLIDAATDDTEDAIPRVYAVTPLQRNNWSCQSNHSYNWMTFKDRGNEPTNPLVLASTMADVYITLVAAGMIPDTDPEKSIWIRSQRGTKVRNRRSQGNGDGRNSLWDSVAGYAPTKRVPLATMYYKRSNDPNRRHFGLSKIAIMAVLTRLIVNVLSWTTEDIKANLALLSIPTKGGRTPKNEDGSPVITALGAFSTIFYDAEKGSAPSWVQGDVSHIEIKLKVCTIFLTEILRLAHLTDISGGTQQQATDSSSSGKSSSGFHAIVNRNELFRELADISSSLDKFSLDVLALAKSWIDDDDWDRKRLVEDGKVRVLFYKGPWTMDPMAQVIETAQSIISMFRQIAPTLCTNAMKQTARAFLQQDDPDLATILKEIEGNAEKSLAQDSAASLLDAARSSLGKNGRGINVSENGDGAAAEAASGANNQ